MFCFAPVVSFPSQLLRHRTLALSHQPFSVPVMCNPANLPAQSRPKVRKGLTVGVQYKWCTGTFILRLERQVGVREPPFSSGHPSNTEAGWMEGHGAITSFVCELSAVPHHPSPPTSVLPNRDLIWLQTKRKKSPSQHWITPRPQHMDCQIGNHPPPHPTPPSHYLLAQW